MKTPEVFRRSKGQNRRKITICISPSNSNFGIEKTSIDKDTEYLLGCGGDGKARPMGWDCGGDRSYRSDDVTEKTAWSEFGMGQGSCSAMVEEHVGFIGFLGDTCVCGDPYVDARAVFALCRLLRGRCFPSFRFHSSRLLCFLG